MDFPTCNICPPTSTIKAITIAAITQKRIKFPKVIPVSSLSCVSLFRSLAMDLNSREMEALESVGGALLFEAKLRFCLTLASLSKAKPLSNLLLPSLPETRLVAL